MYKSGDLACWLDDGNIEYLGRVDTQVKIRGFRIETAEIEAVLNLHPQIKSSVVVAQEQGNDSGTLNKQLVAFYVLSPSDINSPTPLIDSDEIKEYLLQTLPEYMLPMTFVNLDEIPLTPNGKIDRQNLELTSVNLTSGQVYVPPRNELEEKLVTIWSGILQLEPEKIGVNDDFFSLGGHSLLAVMLVSKVKKELEIALPLQALFNLKTVGGTAEYITENTTYSQPGIVLGENSNVEEETVEGVL